MKFLVLFLLVTNIQAQFVLSDGIDLIGNQEKIPPTCSYGCDNDYILEKDEVQSELECLAPAKNDEEYIAIIYKKADEAPQEIKELIPEEATVTPQHGLVITLSILNDNLWMGLLSVYDPESDGDDMGRTHSSELEIAQTLNSGLRLTLAGQMNLYTISGGAHKAADDEHNNYRSQYFTNETLLTLAIDNIQQNRAYYYRAGIGWQNINQEHDNSFWRASAQQDAWHSFLDDMRSDSDIPVPSNTDGDLKENSFILEGLVGFQHTLNSGGVCRLRTYAEIGGRLSQIEDASYIQVTPGAELQLGKAFAFGGELSTYFHQTGTNTEASYYGKVGPLQIEMITPLNGILPNYMEYNLDTDPMMKISLIIPVYNSKKRKQ